MLRLHQALIKSRLQTSGPLRQEKALHERYQHTRKTVSTSCLRQITRIRLLQRSSNGRCAAWGFRRRLSVRKQTRAPCHTARIMQQFKSRSMRTVKMIPHATNPAWLALSGMKKQRPGREGAKSHQGEPSMTTPIGAHKGAKRSAISQIPVTSRITSTAMSHNPIKTLA